MSITNSFIQDLDCPVCQCKTRLAIAPDLCAGCGWEFMYFMESLPLEFQRLLKAKQDAHIAFRASLRDLQKTTSKVAQQQALSNETLQIAKKNCHELETTHQAFTQKKEASEKQLEAIAAQKKHQMAEIKKLEALIEKNNLTHSERIPEHQLLCTYQEGLIQVECSNLFTLRDLPRLVLGISLKNDFQLVTYAEIIYLLPPLETFSKTQQRDANVFEKKYALTIPRGAYFKFGSYQLKNNQSFNIITK